MAGERIAFQGLPARICWLGLGERHKAGLMFNELVRSGKVKAPIWVRICAEIIAATKPRLPGVRLMARLGRKTPLSQSPA